MDIYYRLPSDIQNTMFRYFESPTAKMIKHQHKDVLIKELNHFFNDWKLYHFCFDKYDLHCNILEALYAYQTEEKRDCDDKCDTDWCCRQERHSLCRKHPRRTWTYPWIWGWPLRITKRYENWNACLRALKERKNSLI